MLTQKTRPSGRVFVQRGFTLVELIVTIIILGILAVVAGAKFTSTDRFTQLAYTDTLANALRYAHKLALVSGCETRVRLNASDVSLFQRATDCDSGSFTTPVTRVDGSVFVEVVPSGVTVTDLDIYFDQSGRPFSHVSSTALAAEATISIDGVVRLTIEPETGYVH